MIMFYVNESWIMVHFFVHRAGQLVGLFLILVLLGPDRSERRFLCGLGSILHRGLGLSHGGWLFLLGRGGEAICPDDLVIRLPGTGAEEPYPSCYKDDGCGGGPSPPVQSNQGGLLFFARRDFLLDLLRYLLIR